MGETPNDFRNIVAFKDDDAVRKALGRAADELSSKIAEVNRQSKLLALLRWDKNAIIKKFELQSDEVKSAFFAGCDYGSKYAGDQYLGTPERQRGFDQWKPVSGREQYFVSKDKGFWWVTDRLTGNNHAQTDSKERADEICRALNTADHDDQGT